MADIINMQELADAKLDAQSLERFINGGADEEVLTRLSQQYPTIKKLLLEFQKYNGRAYKTYAEMDSDKANLSPKTKVTVTNDATASNNGDWQWDGVAFTKSAFDPISIANIAAGIKVSSLSSTTEKLNTIVARNLSDNANAFSNNFTNLVLLSELSNQSINYLSINMGWRSNFTKIRMRIFTGSDLSLINGGRTLDNYLSDKTILRDVTYDAVDVCFGQTRIKYQNIDSTLNVEMRIPFDILSNYSNAIPIGFLLEATKADGTTGIISCSKGTTSGKFYYSENNLNLGQADLSAQFTTGLQKQGYGELVRQLTSGTTTQIDAVKVSKTDFGNSFFAIAKGFKFLKNMKFNSVSLFLSGLAAVDYLRYTIFSISDSAATANWMGQGAATAVYSDIVRLDNIKDDASYYEVEFPFDRSLITIDQSVGIVVQAMNADGSAARLGFRVSTPHLSNLSVSERGYYAGIVSDSQIGLNGFDSSNEISFIAKYYKNILQTKVSETSDSNFDNKFLGLSTQIDNVVNENLAVSFDFTYQNMQRKTTTSKTLNFEATATRTDTKNINLLWSGSVSWENRNTMLARYMRNVVVKQGTTTLVENTDYTVYSWYGKINGSQAKNGVDVSVTYTYEPFRVDVVAFNLYTEQLEIIKGTERTQDPYEYLPTLTARYKPVAVALVWGQTVEFFPMGDCFEIAGLPTNPSGDFEATLSHNRKCLNASITRLNRGQSIQLIGYGDSITATGSGVNPVDVANGITRDRIEFLSDWYPSDTISKIETFTRDNDGTTHAKIGWNWSLIKYIKDFYNVDVNYQNWAIGGTNIFSGRDRLQYVLPTVNFGDLVVLAYGTNDGLDLDALNDVVQGFKSKGANIILMPTPIANPANNHPMSNESEWAKLNQRMVNEAMRMGCAIVPTWHYLLDHSPMSIGLSSKFRSNQNLINHPGLYEFQCYGKMLVSAFTG